MSTTEEKLRAQFPDVNYVKLTQASEKPEYRYPGFRPGSEVLTKGHVKEPGRRAFHTDVIFERDVAVPMRDGITIYTDIFRPVDWGAKKVPAILPWSPYGKTGSGIYRYEDLGPFSCGVPKEATTGYEKFEAPDPAEWCPRGYAIINIDARGAGMSQGNTVWWGIQEAEDIFDTIEWLSKQPWCSGSVVMAGNSWLAIAQINFASRLSHPALKAIAPFEGINDPYRDSLVRGGIVSPAWVAFHQAITAGFAGAGRAEDIGGMTAGHPLYDEYWRSKNINTANIDIPMYATASYSATGLHLDGSIKTWRNAKTKDKWLRFHSHQEWYDLYRPEVSEDLQKFFDRYCKNVDNGWERTPPLRLSLLGMDGSPAPTIKDRPEKEYPLARQRLVKYYLDASNHSLLPHEATTTSETSYQAHSLTATSVSTSHIALAEVH
jgi:predicted acyl esterase